MWLTTFQWKASSPTSSTTKMEVIYSSKTLVTAYKTTQHHNPGIIINKGFFYTVCLQSSSHTRTDATRRLQVLTAVSMKATAFWHIVPCRLVEVDHIGAYCLHHKGR
jgi:CRISPR/Cas system CMR-associated protein Cmr5 small subunit